MKHQLAATVLCFIVLFLFAKCNEPNGKTNESAAISDSASQTAVNTYDTGKNAILILYANWQKNRFAKGTIGRMIAATRTGFLTMQKKI